ncbi:MAG: ComF family protein [Bacteroidales bacterium]|nr:ComF family protein [Bacteroidales bacterium]
MVQSLIHQFKYKGKKDIGFLLGKLYGYELMQSKLFEQIDLIIPVPLHRKKLLKRGFNQSAIFASGLANSMNIKMDTNNLSRSVFSETQTKKSRLERWKNVEHIFRLKHPEDLCEKKVLLVDDVVTTGATMEACIQTLQTAGRVQVSVCTIACTVL